MSVKAAQRQIIASVVGIEGFFAQVSGGEITSSAEKVYDGGNLQPETLCGVAEIGNITLTRPYNPVRDQPILRRLRGQVGRFRADVVVQDTDCDLVAIGQPRVYNQAVLVGLSDPDGDASSGSAATYTLTFSPGGVK